MTFGTGSIKDEIARLRYEARRFRDLAKNNRELVAALKRLPIGSRDPVAVMTAQDRVTEYVRAAQGCEAKINEWRAQLGQPKEATS